MDIVAFTVWLALSWVPVLLLARVSPRGLLFGVHVGLRPGPEAARAVAGGWFRNYLLVTLAAAVAGLTRFGVLSTLAAGLVAAAVLVAGLLLAYHLAHLQARILAVPPARPEDAAAAAQGRSRDLFPAAAMLVVAAGAGLAAVHAAAVYDALPEQIPMHFDGEGKPDGWSARSWGTVLLVPLTALGSGGVLALMAWVSVRTAFGRGVTRAGVSPAVREQLQASMARFLSSLAMLVSIMLAMISVGALRTALGQTEGLGRAPIAVVLLLVVVSLAGAVMFTVRSRKVAGGEHYKGGLLYVNREDPAVFVPKRVGLGWTLNFGNPRAYLVLMALVALPIVIAVVLGRSRN